MVSLVSSVSLVDFLLHLHRTRYDFHIELMEETKETEEISLVSSLQYFLGRGGVNVGLLRLLGLLRQFNMKIIPSPMKL